MLRRSVLAVVAMVFIMLFSACQKGGDDPASFTEDFWKAVRSAGIKAAKSYTTAESRKAIEKGFQMSAMGNFEIGEAEVSGDTARVVLIDTDSADRKEFITTLVKEDGKWKVDLVQTVEEMMGSEAGRYMRILAQ
jgi:hypothetical protein